VNAPECFQMPNTTLYTQQTRRFALCPHFWP
jgi:hypothetical protein